MVWPLWPDRFKILNVILEDSVMYRMQINTKLVGRFSIFCILLLCAGATQLQAGEDITGKWEFKMNTGEHEMTAKACFSKNEDGTYSGTWTPDMPKQTENVSVEGEQPQFKNELENIKFAEDVLTFVQKGNLGEKELEIKFNGTIKEGELVGTMSGEQGEVLFKATRIKPQASPIGQWNIEHKVNDVPIKEKLIISKSEGGSLAAVCESKMENDVISDIKFDDGKLSFTRAYKKDGNDVETSFEGTIICNKLAGKYTSQAGQLDVLGVRICPELIGKWELKTDTVSGTKTALLIINNDMTGTYLAKDVDVSVKELNYDEDKLNFKIELENADKQTIEMDFKGQFQSNAIKGEFSTPNGVNKITGTKISIDAMEAPPSDTITSKN